MVRAILLFLQDLSAGDPVALTLVGVVAGVAVLLGLFCWKIARDQRREDEETARRRRGNERRNR